MTGLRIPRQPAPADVRAAELAMLPGLIAELRQPPVHAWGAPDSPMEAHA